MSKLMVILLMVVLFGVLAAVTAPPAAAAEYPYVANLPWWSAQTNYMSLEGYLRWMTYKEQGVWLSMPEAKRIVSQQMMSMEQ